MSNSRPTNPPSSGGRGDATRRQILHAAAHQFARRAYHDVGLDDILAEAELTKGAMYFHFRSKHALAMAVIDEQSIRSNAAFEELYARKLSGLETLIESSFVMAVQDINQDLTRSALHLVEAVGRVEALHEKLLGGWVKVLAGFVQDAITEGDITERCDPQDVGRVVVSVYMGLRQTSDLDDSERFLRDLEKSWNLLLMGILQPDRADYFKQFVSRRTVRSISATSTQPIVATGKNGGEQSLEAKPIDKSPEVKERWRARSGPR